MSDDMERRAAVWVVRHAPSSPPRRTKALADLLRTVRREERVRTLEEAEGILAEEESRVAHEDFRKPDPTARWEAVHVCAQRVRSLIRKETS